MSAPDVSQRILPVPHHRRLSRRSWRLLAPGDVRSWAPRRSHPRAGHPGAAGVHRHGHQVREHQTSARRHRGCLTTAIRSGQSRWKPIARAASVHQLGGVLRHVDGSASRHGQDVQAQLPRSGHVLTQPARAVGLQSRPQGAVPNDQAGKPGGGVRHRAARGQVESAAHAELVAAGPHVLQDRLLAPGQRLGAGLGPGERDIDSIPADPPLAHQLTISIVRPET